LPVGSQQSKTSTLCDFYLASIRLLIQEREISSS
jgi:hypothetical protein